MSGRRVLTHPTRKRLREWLDAESGDTTTDDSITMHIDNCERCAARLEEIGGDDGGLDADVGDAIRVAFSPPEDLDGRVLGRIEERKRADRELDLLLGLFSIAKDAAELMMPPGDDQVDPLDEDGRKDNS